MNIAQATQLPDNSSIEEVSFTLNSIGEGKPASPTNPSWGTEWFCQASDSSGKCGVIFKFKKPENNPAKYAGATINVKTSHNREGAMTGIKLKHKGQYRNIYITDSAIISVIGQGAAPAAAARPSAAPAGRTYPPAAQPSSLSPEEYAKHVATCWCQVYDWTADIFKTRLGEDALVRECVTSVVITMQREHIEILPVADRAFLWKEVTFKDKKLGDYTDDQLKLGYAFVLQGKIKTEETVRGFIAAFNSLAIPHSSVYGYILLKEGIDDDTADAILLRGLKSPENMTDDDYKAVIADAKFFEDAKALQASKATPFDDAETSLD